MATKASKASKASKARKVVRKAAPGRKKGPRAAKKGAHPAPGGGAGLPLRELAGKLRADLLARGFDPVLTGRSCAALYAGRGIKPTSVDFVVTEYSPEGLEEAMRKLGWRACGGHTYLKARCPFDVVFGPPPLEFGHDLMRRAATVKGHGGAVKLLAPTDCVLERLSAYYQWGDREALADAVAVARRHPVDLEFLKRWSEHEWHADRFAEFLRMLQT